ncbi:MAG: trypsin-like serine protease [Nanoarchaeota archaeon]|nr:trypsin-like serine protease [Nanoarchaeota archaeon]MBU1644314.1 trypsin-like serine protease [Nanoarchaeota archaeon]MBU1976361.1 trypsin-like serine protease [Nanoarchaeota archaeon]
MKKKLLTLSSALLMFSCGSETKINSFDFPKKNPHIINGTLTDQSQFPSVAALIDYYGSEWCSGTLIKPDFIITAAHCIPSTPTSMKVVYGVSDIYQSCEDCKHEIALVKANPNYDFNGDYGWNDIGWVLLKEPIKDAVTAEVLPEKWFSSVLHIGDLVKIAGYGNDSNWNSGFLNSAEAPIIDFFTSAGSVNGNFNRNGNLNRSDGFRSSFEQGASMLEMVVGLDDTGAPNLCYGDSGGPTYVEYNGSVFLTGITSRIPPGKPAECGHGAVVGLPGHYQKITEEVYLELKNCRDYGDCGEEGGAGGGGAGGNGVGDGGAGGSDSGGSSIGFPEPSEEPFVMLDRTACNYSKDDKENSGAGYVLLLGMAGLLGLRRRKN